MSIATSFPGFKLRITRWGAIYLLAMVVLGFAAVNTGNNALMAMLGVALGSYVVSGTWSRQVLGSVVARAKVSKEVFAGRPTLVEVELENTSKIFPAYGLVIRDRLGQTVVVERLLPCASRSRHSVEVRFDERGWQQIGPWQLEVVLPLGFFLKSKELVCSRRVLVYPALLRTSSAEAALTGGNKAPDALEDRGREGDVVQLREFREGDDRRQLHWKQTARQQRLIVVDRQRWAERPAILTVDPRLARPEDPRVKRRFEHMISDVATGAVRRLERGEAVGLVVGRTVVEPVRSMARAARILRPLAEVEPLPVDAPPPARFDREPVIAFRVEDAG